MSPAAFRALLRRLAGLQLNYSPGSNTRPLAAYSESTAHCDRAGLAARSYKQRNRPSDFTGVKNVLKSLAPPSTAGWPLKQVLQTSNTIYTKNLATCGAMIFERFAVSRIVRARCARSSFRKTGRPK